MLALPAPTPTTSSVPSEWGRKVGVNDLLSAFLRGRSPATLRGYRADLDHFAQYLGEPDAQSALSRIFSGDAGTANLKTLNWVHSQLEAGLSSATITRRLSALRSVSLLARQLGLINWEISVQGPKSERRRDMRGPETCDWLKLWGVALAEGAKPEAVRNRAILQLLYSMGLRRGEVVAMRLDDVQDGGAAVTIVGKGKREKTKLKLPTAAREALRAWLEVRGTWEGPLFVATRYGEVVPTETPLTGESIRKFVLKLGVAAGIRGTVRPHGLRHSAITAAIGKFDVEIVQRFSRHKDVSTLLNNYYDMAGVQAEDVSDFLAGE